MCIFFLVQNTNSLPNFFFERKKDYSYALQNYKYCY
jgi:hypothetical protein